MKKIILFWLVSAICAAIMYIVSTGNENLSDWVVSVGFIACGVPFFILLLMCFDCHGLPETDKTANSIFSWFAIAFTMLIEYGVVRNVLVELSLICSTLSALLLGLFSLWFGEEIVRKRLQELHKNQ